MYKMTIAASSTALALILASSNTLALTLYEDPETHQVFTQDAPGLVKLEDEHQGITVKSKAVTLKFSGKHYLGFVSSKDEGGDTKSQFETRRNYIQVKAYFNKTDFMRVTLDTFQETKATSTSSEGSWLVRLKYAYLYLDNILPNTGVEFGQAHRPWIDYEEHHAWLYRSISKVYIEDDEGGHLTNSADLGVNFKTQMPMFSSEIGAFNGAGYHAEDDGSDLSVEARLTVHPLGTGKKKPKPQTDTYLDISYFGIKSLADNTRNNADFTMQGIHAVYNMPMFLVAAQYVTSDNESPIGAVTDNSYKGDGYSVNFEVRPTKMFGILGRYDEWDQGDQTVGNKGGDRKQYIIGGVYHYNKNVDFIINVTKVDYDDNDPLNSSGGKLKYKDSTDLMFTAEVNW
jgi:hypothetical protein